MLESIGKKKERSCECFTLSSFLSSQNLSSGMIVPRKVRMMGAPPCNTGCVSNSHCSEYMPQWDDLNVNGNCKVMPGRMTPAKDGKVNEINRRIRTFTVFSSIDFVNISKKHFSNNKSWLTTFFSRFEYVFTSIFLTFTVIPGFGGCFWPFSQRHYLFNKAIHIKYGLSKFYFSEGHLVYRQRFPPQLYNYNENFFSL